jgi:pimeloyl-ACP methyl ester carboxylesterase
VFELVQDRTVVAFDFRGRGLSDRADPLTYRPDVELADTVGFLEQLGIEKCAVLGTSRGGIVGLLMASHHRARMAGLMLNDIGPEIDSTGLKRIVGYVGTTIQFENWQQAAHALARSSVGFRDISEQEWLEAARMVFAECDGRPATDHDPALSINLPTVAQIETDGVADMWGLVPHLNTMPLAILRGEGSDLLSRATVLRLTSLVPSCVATDVEARGHVPFLTEPDAQRAIRTWLTAVDAK